MLSLYRQALALRRQLPALGDGTMQWLDIGATALAFAREPGFTCIVNLGEDDLPLPDHRTVVLASQPIGRTIPSDTAVWLSSTS
jgi:alpha-glucosidase